MEEVFVVTLSGEFLRVFDTRKAAALYAEGFGIAPIKIERVKVYGEADVPRLIG